MVKQLECDNTFSFTWEQVAKAFWRRYPNPESLHVLSEDTLSREMRGDAVYSKRILTKTNSVPKWGEHFVRKSQVVIVEESLVSPAEKKIITYTRNVGYNRVMSIEESVMYIPSPENESQTLAVRTATIDSKIFGFRRAIEGFGLERFRKNCAKAVSGFNYVMNSLYPSNNTSSEENVKALSHFQETKGKIKEKAKRVGEIAIHKAESITTMYAVCKESSTP